MESKGKLAEGCKVQPFTTFLLLRLQYKVTFPIETSFIQVHFTFRTFHKNSHRLKPTPPKKKHLTAASYRSGNPFHCPRAPRSAFVRRCVFTQTGSTHSIIPQRLAINLTRIGRLCEDLKNHIAPSGGGGQRAVTNASASADKQRKKHGE